MDDVVVVSTDLFFAARISSAAQHAGREVRFLNSDAAVGSVERYRLALIDLDAHVDVPAAIRALRAVGGPAAPIVAFGPHLDTEGRKAARGAGANRALAKSKFITELPQLMSEADISATSDERNRALEQLGALGRRLQELGAILQDRDRVTHLFFAPAPHVADTEDAVVLQAQEYMPWIAVDTLQAELDRIRAMGQTAEPGD